MQRRERPGLARELGSFAYEIITLPSRLVRVKRVRRHRQVVIILTRPRLKTYTKLRRRLAGYSIVLSRVTTGMLLAAGVGGIIYSLGPVVFIREGSTLKSQQIIAPVSVEPKKPVGLPRSAPTRLEIPDISLTTDLIKLGKNDDGSLATPDRYDVAGWYEYAPTPGEIGPAIIVGHVDNYLGAAVFFNLKLLQPGQLIHVTREDGQVVDFKVDKVELFDQSNFPTDAVYGNIDYPGLRLITCGGTYNPLTGHYSHNTVVYASKV